MQSLKEINTTAPSVNITKQAPSLLRTLFLHHDGIIVGATIAALQQYRLLDVLFDKRRMSVAELCRIFPCNSGYLHVALRCLALQGWLDRTGPLASDELYFEVTPTGDQAFLAFDRYVEVADFIFSDNVSINTRIFPSDQSQQANLAYGSLVRKCQQKWQLPAELKKDTNKDLYEIITNHLDGLLTGPTMIASHSKGFLDGTVFPHQSFSDSDNDIMGVAELLEYHGWLRGSNGLWLFSDLGRLACQFSLHYGLTLSYYPLLCQLPKLIFNSSKNITHVEPGKEEIHVDRTLNVLASGVAHRRYFEDSAKIIIEIFNQEPVEDQPKFIADMGCGDGAWLKRICEVVKTKTIRGQHLNEFPLLMVGADYNVKAQEVARSLLDEAGITNLVIFGDVTDPRQFAEILSDQGIDIHNGLHIRAFIDHNRRYTIPDNIDSANGRKSLSSGAYADENGHPVANRLLEQNMVEHFKKWRPYIERHGLIIIEAHDVDPKVACHYNGKTHATAFDTYHGYSNQYPLDFDAFMELAEEAGLRTISYQQCLYPSRLPFVAISINRFRTSDLNPFIHIGSGNNRHSNEWQPDGGEDMRDGEALHRFLYEQGDLTRPKQWCFKATGMLVEAVLNEIERRIRHLRDTHELPKTLTLVDYGAGTGLATLELIKGLNEKGLLKQIEISKIDFKLILFDFPSGWFAKGHELLKQFPFVHFYSLKDGNTNSVRLVSEILDQHSVDIIIASMVFHLIPPKILPAISASFAEILKQDGLLFWNSPDTAPAPPFAQVIHDTNRELRKEFLKLLENKRGLLELMSEINEEQFHHFSELPELIARLDKTLTDQQRARAQDRADKQILPTPTDLDTIRESFTEYFAGHETTAVSLMRDQDIIDLALLPANQRYINEIKNVKSRGKLIRLLLTSIVIPKFRKGSSGHPKGINLHWVFGQYRRSS